MLIFFNVTSTINSLEEKKNRKEKRLKRKRMEKKLFSQRMRFMLILHLIKRAFHLKIIYVFSKEQRKNANLRLYILF